MAVPESPVALRRRAPSWFDARFVLGVLLVVASVAAGARLVAMAGRTVEVWSLVRPLAGGTVLTRADLRAVPVRLPRNAGRYLAAGRSDPVGRALTRDVGAGELLPRDAVVGRPCGSELSIPVSADHMPASAARGARVDVFATPPAERGGTTGLVLSGVAVQAVDVGGGGLAGGSGDAALVVRVADELAPTVVTAVRSAEIDVVVVARRTGDGCGHTGGAPPGGAPPATPGSAPPGSVPSDGTRPDVDGTETSGGARATDEAPATPR